MQLEIQLGTVQYYRRLVPWSVVQENNNVLADAYYYITEDGVTFISVLECLTCPMGQDINQVNVVHPAWCEILINITLITVWTAPQFAMIYKQDKMTHDNIPRLAALLLNPGAYLNKGDFQQPDC